jgi:hypothetical protein
MARRRRSTKLVGQFRNLPRTEARTIADLGQEGDRRYR